MLHIAIYFKNEKTNASYTYISYTYIIIRCLVALATCVVKVVAIGNCNLVDTILSQQIVPFSLSECNNNWKTGFDSF